MSYVTVATCSLNQWALDFDGNLERIKESIRQSKQKGAKFRIGPELEITGYSCYDHFLENDTILHSWECLADLLQDDCCKDMLIDVGMPVIHRNARYNCRIVFLNKRILLIRPKMFLANDGNYRELRWFTPWMKPRQLQDHYLPSIISKITGQTTVPFGDALVSTRDTVIGIELCEELFTPNAPHIQMGLDGCEIFTNSSGSHHEFQKLSKRIDLIKNATSKSGGCYLYSNFQGMDGERVYFDGCATIALNGQILAQGSQFSLSDVEVVVATFDLEDVRAFKSSVVSRGMQAAQSKEYPRVFADISLKTLKTVNEPIQVFYHTPEEEIRYGPACWLWDFLRRSKLSGFFLPLSGGIDSCSTALIVFSMCELIIKAIKNGDQQVIKDVSRIAGYLPSTAQELNSVIMHTCYMGTSNSTAETRDRAFKLAQGLGSYHLNLNMDSVVQSVFALFQLVTGKMPKYKLFGGTNAENLALQNVQARLRMVLSYLFAQLLPWTRSKQGSLLVLGSANVDETLRGYFTKYDCSSADLNPIGGISKEDLRKFIAYSQNAFNLPILSEFLSATPTAELEPVTENYIQKDEVDMGMTYDELSVFGKLRKISKCGPYSMFLKLCAKWKNKFSIDEIAEKVKRFFFFYSINRHKTTILPPSYHMSSYSPDDNRFDLRPFLYNSGWNWQFRKIDSVKKDLLNVSEDKNDYN